MQMNLYNKPPKRKNKKFKEFKKLNHPEKKGRYTKQILFFLQQKTNQK